MRSAVIGAFFADAPAEVEEFVSASTTITHTDPRAVVGATAVARLTAWVVRDNLTKRPDADEFLSLLATCAPADEEWKGLIESMRDATDAQLSVEQFADKLGLGKGVSGYIFHTVPVAVYAWFRHFGDFEGAVTSVLDCGGDTDTTGAIIGALAGATTGERGIPRDWLRGVIEWPRNVQLLKRLGDELSEESRRPGTHGPVRYFWPGCLVRNFVFLVLVLLHGLRRLFPPY
jgi:ADP-ribosylglycohydrolase